MTKTHDCPGFEILGKDVKAAREALKLSRRQLAEQIGIAPRYLANIENSGTLPSVPILYALVKICKLPVKKYFFPNAENEGSEHRRRTSHKLKLCPEQYLSVIEGALDGAIKSEK